MQRRLRGEDFVDTYDMMGASGSSLRVCKGYKLNQEWARVIASEEARPLFYLEPKYEEDDEDGWWFYEPLKENPNLFLDFARLREKQRANHARPEEIARTWTNKYGPLGCNFGYYQDRHIFEQVPVDSHEFVYQFFAEVDRAAAVLAFYEVVLREDEDAVLPLLERFPTWPVELFVYYTSTDAFDLYGGRLGFALYLVTYEVVRMVQTFTFPKLTLHPGPALPSRLSSGYGFFTLLGAMYLQMYWLVAAGEKHVTPCRYCGKLVSLMAATSDAEDTEKRRKPRQDRRYCDNACRQRHHYQTKGKFQRKANRNTD